MKPRCNLADYNIRGGLGTQIFSFLTCYAIAIENKETVDTVFFNGGNYIQDKSIIKDMDRIFIYDILEFCNSVNIPKIILVSGNNKTLPFKNPNAALLRKHWFEIMKNIKLKRLTEQTEEVIAHIRGTDRALVNPERFLNPSRFDFIGMCQSAISEDIDICKRLMIDPNTDTLEDWYRVLNAKAVLGGYSTFTLLAGALNPNLKLTIISKEKSDNSKLIPDEEWKNLELFVEMFPNISFYR